MRRLCEMFSYAPASLSLFIAGEMRAESTYYACGGYPWATHMPVVTMIIGAVLSCGVIFAIHLIWED